MCYLVRFEYAYNTALRPAFTETCFKIAIRIQALVAEGVSLFPLRLEKLNVY